MEGFIEWILENSMEIYAAGSMILIFVWVFYAHIFFRDFRSRHHPRIMIQQTPDMDIDSKCMIINLSQNIINIANVRLTGEWSDKHISIEISDYRRYSSEELATQEKKLLNQGPLKSGGYIQLGSFEELVSRMEDENGGESIIREGKGRLELRVLFFAGTSSRPLGARRCFSIISEGKKMIAKPETLDTIQMSSLRQRMIVKSWLKEIEGIE